MKKLVFILSVLFLMIGTTDVQAQWLKNVGQKAVERAKDRAKNKVERKVDDAVDKTVDGAFDEAEDAVKGEGKKNKTTGSRNTDTDKQVVAQDGEQQQLEGQTLEMAYAKSDFVPGDEILFDDSMTNEQMGEFPSQWDLLNGNAEIASLNGMKCINLEAGTEAAIAPLMKDMKNYLPDVFTFEMDYWVNNYTETNNPPSQKYYVYFLDKEGNQVMQFDFAEGTVYWHYLPASSEENRSGRLDIKEKTDSWSHLAISFNKRAFKAYINGIRVTNIPSMAAPASLKISNSHWNDHRTLIANVRIAKGAVPLYDRMMTDGKFITYGITFDVGKSTIKPESMGEINRIVKLMTDTPDLKFSVEGHTDSTGNAAGNQTLSEARSKAIVNKLVELGIAANRLTAVGKGQTTPIADNGTDEGRAKNRRVEFVRI